jgi:hypothetical protein
LTVRGNFLINAGVTYNSTMTGAMNLAGNLTNDGAALSVSQPLNFNGTAPQTMSGSGAITLAGAVTLNNAAGLSLGRDVAISGATLTLTSGLLTLGTNTLTLGSTTAIAGTPTASNMIVADGTGSVCKIYGAAGSFTFPIGDNTAGADYSPAFINYTAGTFPGNACVRVTDASHPNVPGSATNYITRYWTATGTVTGPTYTATFTYTPGDIVGTEASMSGKKWDGASPWTTLAVAGGNQFTGTGLTSFSAFTAFDTPLAVTLASFTAQGGADRVAVAWETVSEFGNAGFNLYRADSAVGPQTLLAYVPSQAPGSTVGFAYSYDDLAVQAGQTYWYWLEDVSLGGATTLHGPVSATVQAPTAVTLSSVTASPAAASSALPWLLLAAGAGLAVGASNLRRRT